MKCSLCQNDLVYIPNFFPMCTQCGESALTAESITAIRRVFQAYQRLQDEGGEDRAGWLQ